MEGTQDILKPVQIYLPAGQWSDVRRLAAEDGEKGADVVRRLVADWLCNRNAPIHSTSTGEGVDRK